MNKQMSNKRNSDDFNEMKLLILELSQQFNRKFEDQTRVIRQQRDRLESQQQQLHNQRAIIEELAWQIRDLRDSVRKCSETISNVQTKYHGNSPESHLKLNIPDTPSKQLSNQRAEYSPIYDSINFDASLVTAKVKEIQSNNNNKSMGTLQRQNAIENCDQMTDTNHRNPPNVRDIHDFLERCIPPPPVTSPPHDTDSDPDQNPVQISDHTLDKLNSLYSLYKMRPSMATEYDEIDDVVLRLRKFNDDSARPFRGSSKAMCSLVSNVEDEYLPQVNKDDGGGDDNRSTNCSSNQFIRQRSTDTDNEENCRQQEKPIYSQNDEVYI